jgi:hypothetical protein
MKPARKIVLLQLLVIVLTFSTLSCRGQFLWLGFDVGGGTTWFSDDGYDTTRLTPGAGMSFGFFVRYGSRPYYQLGVEWLYSTNQMKFQVKPGSAQHDNVPFHNFRIPLTVGYEVVHLPRFKWRVGGGVFIGTATILSSNDFEFTRQDIRNPQYGLIGETGIQLFNFLVMIDYNYCLNRFFSSDADTYGQNVRSHLQIFSLKVGMQF